MIIMIIYIYTYTYIYAYTYIHIYTYIYNDNYSILLVLTFLWYLTSIASGTSSSAVLEVKKPAGDKMCRRWVSPEGRSDLAGAGYCWENHRKTYRESHRNI